MELDDGIEIQTVTVDLEGASRAAARNVMADGSDRSTYIGSSDAPVILGLSSWKSRGERFAG